MSRTPAYMYANVVCPAPRSMIHISIPPLVYAIYWVLYCFPYSSRGIIHGRHLFLQMWCCKCYFVDLLRLRQDSSFAVKFGLADIQGNSFEKLTGKPFAELRPMTSSVLKSINTRDVIGRNSYKRSSSSFLWTASPGWKGRPLIFDYELRK
jgi:hypothetical protein